MIEALPKVLPSFSQKLVEYTEKNFKDSNIAILSNTSVKQVKEKEIIALDRVTNKEITIPYGLLIWATGNTGRPLIKNLMDLVPNEQTQKRGLLVNDFMQVKGFEDIYALGDCTCTKQPPTRRQSA